MFCKNDNGRIKCVVFCFVFHYIWSVITGVMSSVVLPNVVCNGRGNIKILEQTKYNMNNSLFHPQCPFVLFINLWQKRKEIISLITFPRIPKRSIYVSGFAAEGALFENTVLFVLNIQTDTLKCIFAFFHRGLSP